MLKTALRIKGWVECAEVVLGSRRRVGGRHPSG